MKILPKFLCTVFVTVLLFSSLSAAKVFAQEVGPTGSTGSTGQDGLQGATVAGKAICKISSNEARRLKKSEAFAERIQRK
jgi:hypothetical protein